MRRFLLEKSSKGRRKIHGLLPPVRALSTAPVLIERGRKIDVESLFKYTNGRFLTKEAEACRRRYMHFDLDRLCSAVSSICDSSPVREIEKMEGGFSKALLMRMENGKEVVAKIPFKIAGPSRYTTAAEVAALRYVAMHTSIPVPKLLAWNTDPSNPVGVEYIIMEKAPGRQLFEKWKTMSEREKFLLVTSLAMTESELTAIRFPAYGSLYLRESMSAGDQFEALDPSIDPSGEFCIGRSCDRAWIMEHDKSAELNMGPWKTLSDFGFALADRELMGVRGMHEITLKAAQNESLQDQIAVLDMIKAVMDLHAGNIYVADDDPTRIVSIIDWQGLVVSPLFIQARFPQFLVPEDDYELGTDMPKLSQEYEEMDDDAKELADAKLNNAKLSKAYELRTGKQDIKVYKARFVPWCIRDLFARCDDIQEDSVVELRACLIEIANSWEKLGISGDCPFEFDHDKLHQHQQQFDKFRRLQDIRCLAERLLATDSEGWISPRTDFSMMHEENR